MDRDDRNHHPARDWEARKSFGRCGVNPAGLREEGKPYVMFLDSPTLWEASAPYLALPFLTASGAGDSAQPVPYSDPTTPLRVPHFRISGSFYPGFSARRAEARRRGRVVVPVLRKVPVAVRGPTPFAPMPETLGISQHEGQCLAGFPEMLRRTTTCPGTNFDTSGPEFV